MSDENNRETGARAPQPKQTRDARDEVSQKAAENKQPTDKYGNTEPRDDASEKTRHSDGQNMRSKATPSPATERTSGAGPAIAERSKDAKTTKPGRQAGAYVKR